MKLGTRIRRVRRMDTERYRVAVEYTDGFTGTVDLGSVFEHAAKRSLVAEILRGGLFGRCFVESGALAWPTGYELCPDAVRARIIEQRRGRAA